MASWIKNTSSEEKHIVLLHQPDLHCSTPTLVLSCLVALIYRDTFVEGPAEALPFVANLAQNYPYTKMGFSQKLYMNYFKQVLLFDFTPLARPLMLSKILFVIDEQETGHFRERSMFSGSESAK